MPGELALVLSGGSVRGAAHVGALRVLERYGLIPDIIAGTSAGSMAGSLYGSGLPVLEIDRIYRRYKERWRYLDLNYQGILKSAFTLNLKHFQGLYHGRKLASLIAEHLRCVKDFSDYVRPNLPLEVKPVLLSAVNLADGQETIFAPPGVKPRGEFRVCSRKSIAFAVHCSITIPGAFVPVACRPGPDCPYGFKRTQYYVDGGIRDMYPITVPVRLAGAKRIIGINLGYAGMRRDLWENGPAGYFSQVMDIMGHDQVAADYQDAEVQRAQVVTVNPLIYDVGGFESEYIPQIIERGEAVMEECLRAHGLRPNAGRAANLAKLFPPGRALLEYPAKGTPAFNHWLNRPIKGPVPLNAAGRKVGRVAALN